jgi:hypothetical protein
VIFTTPSRLILPIERNPPLMNLRYGQEKVGISPIRGIADMHLPENPYRLPLL